MLPTARRSWRSTSIPAWHRTPASPPPPSAQGLTTTPSSAASSPPRRAAAGKPPDARRTPIPEPPMLRIRKISDSHTPANRSALKEAQAIIGAQFPGMPSGALAKLADQLDNPFKYRFVAKLLVAEDTRGRVKALALLLDRKRDVVGKSV